MTVVAKRDQVEEVSIGPRHTRQDELLRGLLRNVLTTLTLPSDIVDEVIAESERDAAATPAPFTETTLRIEVAGPESHEYYPIVAEGTASCGLFLLHGHNSTGKTTLLITASLLLGTDWEDPDFQAFLEKEERYIETGKRFQKEMERGARRALIEIANDAMRVAVTVEDGELTLTINDESRTFRLRAEGWRPYQMYVRPLLRAQFIPQKRDYLRQVYLEVVDEVLDRISTIEALLLARSGEVMVGASQRELDELDREVERQRGQYERAKTSVEEMQERLDVLNEIRSIEEGDEEAHQRMIEHARLSLLKTEIQNRSEDVRIAEVELSQAKRDLAAKRRQHSIAYPALMRLITAVKQPRQQYGSRVLRDKIDQVAAQYRISAWLDFRDEYSFAGPELYSRLAEEVARERGVTRTFPFHDVVTDQYVSTITDLESVLVAHRTWSRDFEQIVRGPLEQFARDVSECIDIRTQDLERLRAEITTDQRTVEASEQEIADLNDTCGRATSELSSALQASVGTARQDLMRLAESRITELELSLARWRLGPPSVDQLVDRLRVDPEKFWADGGASGQVGAASTELNEQETLVEGLRLQFQEAEDVLRRRREEVESSPEHRYARAYAVVEDVSAEFLRVLRLPFAEQATQQHALMAWRQQDLMPDEVDVFDPLWDGIRRLVLDRCGSYYDLQDGEWLAWPITDVDLRAGTIEVAKRGEAVRVPVLEELGTGARAAMTVRSLASRTRAPQYATVLLVDEWGDVEQGTLAQVVYEGIMTLPNPVVSVFTLPGRFRPAAISDARSEPDASGTSAT